MAANLQVPGYRAPGCISPALLIYESGHNRLIQTLNPSARRHRLWASIHLVQADSPCSTMHSSLSLFVSGHAQHIFFFGFDSVAGAAVAADEPPFTAGISGDGTATGSGTSALPIFSGSVSGTVTICKMRAKLRTLFHAMPGKYFHNLISRVYSNNWIKWSTASRKISAVLTSSRELDTLISPQTRSHGHWRMQVIRGD